MELVREFCEFESFYNNYAPLSPFGKDDKHKRSFQVSLDDLTQNYNDTEVALKFLQTNSVKYQTLQVSLRRICEIPVYNVANISLADIQLAKRFLLHVNNIFKTLPANLQQIFELNFTSLDLLSFLSISNTEPLDESFYISEQYSLPLCLVRKQIRDLDNNIRTLKKDLYADILTNTGIDFRYQDFVIMHVDKLSAASKYNIAFEPFDSQHFCVKPLLPSDILTAISAREKLLSHEKQEETLIINDIANKINAERVAMLGYVNAICRIDIAFAKAALVEKFNLVRPNIAGSAADMSLVKARFIPLEEQCATTDVPYQPLTIHIKNKANVVIGSNMGGKTVVLRTIAFCQTLAQMGFFVPAEAFTTHIFSSLCYIGASREHAAAMSSEGLSGFGYEIISFQNAWKKRNKPLLLLLDEFARTTNSREASALVSGVLQAISAETNVVGFISTHFVELKLPGTHCSVFRMQGIDSAAYKKYYASNLPATEASNIHWINKCMRFNVIEEQTVDGVFDAINIAQILGLDASIVSYARNSLDGIKN